MGQPLGKYIGNAFEVYESLQILRNETEPAAEPTRELSIELSARMLLLTGIADNIESAKHLCESKLAGGEALELFRANIIEQGGDASVCDDPSSLLDKSLIKVDVTATAGGYVSAIDTEAVGNAVCTIGGGRTRAEDTVDHAVGMTSELKIGDQISAGDVLCTLFVRKENDARSVIDSVQNAYQLSGSPTKHPPLVRFTI
jgi:thymidine phosphorylase